MPRSNKKLKAFSKKIPCKKGKGMQKKAAFFTKKLRFTLLTVHSSFSAKMSGHIEQRFCRSKSAAVT